MPTIIRLLLSTTLLVASAQAEQRQAYNSQSPDWLQAVGKLNVPGVQYKNGYGRHQLENCSGTLVAPRNSSHADTVVTAWHCLEYYRDLSKPITFTLTPVAGKTLSREAYRVADGGGMYADWAVLKLYDSVSIRQVAALEIHPQRADMQRPVTMAGFSGDAGVGADGAVLTYHASCNITRQASAQSESDCSAYKGASGGAVIQLSAEGRAQLSGVISQGNNQTVSIYVPVSGFRRLLKQHLN
ncbi:MAG: trypsin-like peptidase domain-containing protein [Halioglobus sp.]|nr:trypsin-like peptidase domain-containing protein [Halioglobus sp.]MDG2327274.1 trypsin-like peptidase domain-containing protein [Halioglobus sp.]